MTVNASQQKCISLDWRAGVSTTNSYLVDGLNVYCSQAGAHWVRFWVHWDDVDPTPVPSDWGDQWDRYRSPNIKQFEELDAAIADANLRGIYVLLSVSQFIPTWANGAPGPEPGTAKEATRRFPSSVAIGSPWERFVTYCYNRYRYVNAPNYQGVHNLTGPIRSNPYGNPRSAWCALFGVVNEPNYEHWQDFDPGCTAAQMMMTADSAIAPWGAGAALLGPDLSDSGTRWKRAGEIGTHTTYDSPDVKYATDYFDCANQILGSLQNWHPSMPWFWSHHTYNDIKDGTNNRAEAIRQLLYNKNWRGGGNRIVCLTEGGWSLNNGGWGTTTTQEAKMRNWWYLYRHPDFSMATQHLIRNGAAPSTGMTDISGNPDPLWTTFIGLQPHR